MKKIVKFFTAFVIFLFIFTACSGKGNSGKQEISDSDPENQVSDKDELSDDDPENQTPEEVNCKADGSEEFLTFADIDYGGCRGRGCIFRDISRKTEETSYTPDIYKIDGNILWLANRYNGLISVDVSDPKKPKKLGSLKIKGKDILEIHIHKGTAFVVSQTSAGEGDGETGNIGIVNMGFVKITAVDISEPSKLSVAGEINIRGWLAVSSKLIGDILYFALEDSTYIGYGCDNGDDEVSKNGVTTLSLNIKNPKDMKIIDKFFIKGPLYPAVHFSEKSVYVAETARDIDSGNESDGSLITMLDISGDGKIVKKAEFRAEGIVGDQQKIYEKGTTFYAVSSSSSSRIIESFDLSDPSNIKRLAKLEFAQAKVVETTMFDGEKMYASLHEPYEYEDSYLEIIDISDPSDLKQLGTAQIPPWSQFAVNGNSLMAIGKSDTLAKNAIISMYDISDPENVKTVNSVTFGSNYIDYLNEYDKRWFKHPVFQVFDDPGLILLPVTENNDFGRQLSRLYIVSFAIENGLEVRGFIEAESAISRGAALKDSVLAISDSHLVSANLPKSGEPEGVSEIVLAETVPSLENCSGYPCGFLHPEFRTYNPENGELLWKSGALELSYQSISTMKNSSRAYIYGDISSKEKPYNEILKVLEFSKDGIFKESDFKSKDQFPPIKMAAVSENNIVAFVTTWEEKQLSFFDIDDLKNGIKQLPNHFDFDWISRIIVNGNTFWVSWCKYQDVDYNANHEIFRCYAASVDVSDPNNPKAGAQINIPGFLSGISSNGRYLYTETFEIQGRSKSDSIHDVYILELNADKTGVCVIKKETVEDYTYENTEKDDLLKTTRQHGYSYPKNNALFLTSDVDSISVKDCRYTKETPSSIKVISNKGKQVFDKTFEGEKFLNDVRDGGFLVLTDKNWTYITPDGKEKTGAFSNEINISNSSSSSQLINGKIYLPVSGSGIITLDVK